MLSYAIRRTLQAVFVIFVMSFVLYCLIGFMPGDPIDILLEGNPSVTPEVMAQMRALYGADQPLITRYWRWLLAALQGDLGYSNLYFRPVLDLLWPAMMQTVRLMALTLAIAIPVSLLLGTLAARRPDGWADNAIGLFAFASISSPIFWIALVFIIIFAVKLRWLPPGGAPLGADPSLLESARYLVLPVLTLALYTTGQLVRYVRGSLIETLNSDFIRTARAKGLSEPAVIVRHGLRNALIPVVTVLALSFGALFSGALVVETMFGIVGMGKTIYDSILNQDFNLALVGLLLATGVTLFANLLADFAYAWLDPRITLE
jgi:peptide/nickel transport system permease protein